MRCPECSAQRTKVHTMASTTTEPRVTIALIIVCVVVFLATNGFSGGSGKLWNDWLLYGPAVHFGHDYWRLVTSGFLHSGPIHILFNMYLLWLLGNLLEPTLGSGRFAALFFTALLWGAFGALVATPNGLTVGASGAVFGLMGAAAVEQRARGINPFKTDIGVLILLNLVLSFVHQRDLDRRAHRRPARGHPRRGGLRGRRPHGPARARLPGLRRAVGRRRDRRVGRRRLIGRQKRAGSSPRRSRAAAIAGAQTSPRATAPAGSGTRSGCRMWAMSSRPSTRRGPGREK